MATVLYAIVQVNCPGAKATRLEEFQIPSQAMPECRLSAADDYRVKKQMTFVDEIGFEGEPRKLGAADSDIELRFPLELPDSLEVEVPLDTRVACRNACQRP